MNVVAFEETIEKEMSIGCMLAALRGGRKENKRCTKGKELLSFYSNQCFSNEIKVKVESFAMSNW